MQRLHIGPPQVQNDQVRALAGGDVVAVREPHGARPADAGHLQNTVRAARRGVFVFDLLQDACKVHLPEEVEGVVARRAVRADGEGDPRRGEPVQRRDPACELEV